MMNPDEEARVAGMLVHVLDMVREDVEEARAEARSRGGDPIEDIEEEFRQDAVAVKAFLRGCSHAAHEESVAWIEGLLR